MNMIGGHDADRLDALLFGQFCLIGDHLFPAVVTARWIDSELGTGDPGVLGVAPETTSDEIKSVIHAQCYAMDGTDEGALAAADHADSYTLAHRGSFLVETQDLAIEGRVTASSEVIERGIGDLDDV